MFKHKPKFLDIWKYVVNIEKISFIGIEDKKLRFIVEHGLVQEIEFETEEIAQKNFDYIRYKLEKNFL